MEAIGIAGAVAALFTAIGSVFALRGYRGLRKTRRFVDAAASAAGTVTNSVSRWHSDPGDDPGDDPGVSRLSHPVVRFVTGDGRTVEFESQVGSTLAPKVGQQVTVLYDPLKPKEARIKSFMMLWALPLVFTGLGALLLVPGALMLSVFLLLLAL
jgi:Protein of unknown function (DUF3592)